MKLPRPCILQAFLLVFVLSPIVLLPSAAHTQDAAQCQVPNTGRGVTPAKRTARFAAAAEVAAKADPPDPCLETYIRDAGPGAAGVPGTHAVELLRSAIAKGEIDWGADGVQLVPFLDALALQLSRLASVTPDQLHEAETVERRAIAITEKAYGSDDTHLVGLLNDLAPIVVRNNSADPANPANGGSSQGAPKGAEIYLRELAIEEKAYGPDNPMLVSTLLRLSDQYFNESMGCSWASNGQPMTQQESTDCMARSTGQAEAVLLRAVQIAKTSPGPAGADGSALLGPLMRLADLYGEREKKYTEAENLYRQIADIQARVSGPVSQPVVTDWLILGGIYENDHEYAQAQISLQTALDIAKQLPVPKAGSPGVPVLANILFGLGYLAFQQQDIAGAKSYFQQEFDIVMKGRSDNDPSLIQPLTSMAGAYQRAALYEDAQTLYLRLISIEEKNPQTALDSLGRAVKQDYVDALQSYARLLQFNLQRDADAQAVYLKLIPLEENDPITLRHASALQGYAVLLEGMNRLDDAQTILLQLISLARNDAALAPNYAIALQNYADLLRQMNKPDDAAKVDAQAKAVEAANAAAAANGEAPAASNATPAQ